MIIFGINWAYLQNLYLFIFFVAICFLSFYQLLKTNRIANLLSNNNRLLNNYSFSRKILKVLLKVIGALFLFLSLLGPQWSKKDESVDQRGRDVLIALDISKSMLAEDVKPNRLSAAKDKIKQLVRLLDSDRVALLLFSGTSFIQCPLTRDIDSFLSMLEHVDVETISSGTTAIDKALIESLAMFEACGIDSNKIVVLFTDGEDFSSNLEDVKEKISKENLSVFTVGVGTEDGAPIPLVDINGDKIGHQKYKDGSIVISKLNEDMLNKLSKNSGGTYIKMTKSNKDLELIRKYVQGFEEKSLGSRTLQKYENQYPYFVAISFACFLLEWLL
jgi:Ca-activated chloride channel homolog